MALAALSTSTMTSAFVVPCPQHAGLLSARATWTGRPGARSSAPLPVLKMGAGVAMPEVTVAKPSIGLVSNTESETSVRPEDKFKVLLFNDNGNTREYVSRSLVQVVGMPEDKAFHIMQQANDNGMAQVGVWHQEMADAYSSSLKERGLIADVFPVD